MILLFWPIAFLSAAKFTISIILPHLHKIKLLNSKLIWNKNLISPQLIIC